MKSQVLGLAVLLAGALSAGAQSFVIDWAKADSVKGTPATTVKRDGTVRNLDDKQKELYFSYNLDGLTFDHTAQLCMNLCWALLPGPDDPFIREGQVLTANGTLPIYVDLTPHGTEGTSVVAVRMFDGNNQSDRLDFTVTFVGCVLGITLLAAALSKFFLVEMTRTEQLLCVAGALLMIAPGLLPTLVGAALALPVLLRLLAAWRRSA